MERLELEKATLSEQISSGSCSNQELIDLGQKLGEVVAAIEKMTERWMELAEYL